MFISACRRRSRSRICACTVTSSAVVGSSAISTAGLQARASAIITRWRMPPDIWCGYSFTRRSAAGISTRSSISRARLSAAAREPPSCCSTASAIWSPTVYSGFRLVMGSWKIIAISAPRMRCSVAGVACARSCCTPWRSRNRILPASMRPAGLGNRPMMDRLVTDLPEPDSPTIASVSPRARSKVTPSTDLAMPSRLWNQVFRPCTDSTMSRVLAVMFTAPCAGADRGRRAGRRPPVAATARTARWRCRERS